MSPRFGSLRSKLFVFLPIVATVAFLQYGTLSAVPIASLSLENVKAWIPAKQIAPWRDSELDVAHARSWAAA